MNILLDSNAKVKRECIFKPTFGSGSLHEICNGNGVRVVNFATSENPIVNGTTPSPVQNLKIKVHKTIILPVVLYESETFSR
jgi:hypothetical protein